jgi:hypothetical protein
MHTSPLIPQSVLVLPGKQVPPKQQPAEPPPSGQLVGSQLPQPPCWHSCEPEHVWQAAPLVPHLLVVSPGRHWFWEQQPWQPDWASQMHWPWEQRSPLPHAAPPSQLQVPAAVQVSATVPLLLQPVHAPPS